MNKSDILYFCRYIQIYLSIYRQEYGQMFIVAKDYFRHRFHKNIVFSTAFGTDFFVEIERRIKTNEPIKSKKGVVLGEYDINFNRWLKELK